MTYIPFIDGLRALAVLSVIFFHFDVIGISGGYVGVDIFFVISGFLITGILAKSIEDKKFSLAHFYERRARRILPPLFITFGATALGTWFMFMPHDFVGYARSLMGVSGFASNFIFARWAGYFSDAAMTKPLLHTWSLAVEEQFYLLFPPLLYGLYRLFKKRGVVLFLYAILLLSFALNVFLINASPDKTFYLLHTRAWELLMGSVVFLHWQYIPLSKKQAQGLSILGAFFLAASILLYTPDTVFPGWAAVLPCLGTAFIIWANIQHKTPIKKIFSSKPAVAIGLISYGLYLYHWPVLVFTRYYTDAPMSLLTTCTALIFVFGLAVLSYRLVETPIRQKNLFKNSKSLFIFSGFFLVLFFVFGWTGKKTEGFPARFDQTVLNYTFGKKDYPAPQNCRTHERNDHTLQYCPLGKESVEKPDFLLWGDSHASALIPAADLQAKRHRKTGWAIAYSGCPPLLGVERTDGLVDFSCKAINDHVAHLIHEKNISHVLMAARWEMYLLPWEKGGMESTRRAEISFEEESGMGAFEKSLSFTLKTLPAAVTIIKQVPPQLYDVPTTLEKAAFFQKENDIPLRFGAEIEMRMKTMNEIFDTHSAPSTINPVPFFCRDNLPCKIEGAGKPLYTDTSHLSTHGAVWAAEMLDPFFTTLPRNP